MSDAVFQSKFTNSLSGKIKGKIGEKLTEDTFNRFEKYNYDLYGKTLSNVYIPKSATETSEIDVIYISERGIFVVESKNYSGWIFGRENDQYWTATLPGRRGKAEKNKFYNPLMQNAGHIKHLSNYLKQYYQNINVKFFSIIVFSDRCKFKSIPQTSSHVIIKRSDLFESVKWILAREKITLSMLEVDEIYENLLSLTKINYDTKQAHIDNIRNNNISNPVSPYRSEVPICPLCGRKLVLRTATKGARAGKKFYGCSTYPKCGYIKNIDE